MILIANENGNLVKAVPRMSTGVLGFHRWYGFITEAASRERFKFRKRRGFHVKGSPWVCKFQFNDTADGMNLKAISGCEVDQDKKGVWHLRTQSGNFVIAQDAAYDQSRLGSLPEEENDTKKILIGSLIAFLAIGVSLFWGTEKEEEIAKEEEPVTVKIAIPKEAVRLPKQLLQNLPKSAQTDRKLKRAVQQQLGFLGMLGQQNLTKAVGGVPTQLKDASPGAGRGGSEGSGGELLVGLGKGVKRTTVGNTGTAGLGGIGTKGRGGGEGGYGNTLVASGEGKGLSSIPLSQDMILEGGLDRNVIQATIAKYLSQVRACYNEGLQRNPGLTGLVGMKFEINGAGDLNFAKVYKSSLGDQKVEGCISNRMMTWKFPKPRGGVNVKVSYPFLLRPVNS